MTKGDNHKADWRKALEEKLRGLAPERVAVLCVGNAGRGDDGFGPTVARALGGRLGARVFDGGSVPENELPRVAREEPHTVLILDAVHFGAEPGALRLFATDDMRGGDVSTHSADLSVLEKFLEAACGARVLLLGAQPAGCELGKGLSEGMQGAVESVVAALLELLGGAE